MAQAWRREAWDHTCWIVAMIANANRDPRKKSTPFTPDDFNPLKETRASGAAVMNVSDLKEALSGKKGRLS